MSAAGVALVHGLLGYALIAGLGAELPRQISETLKTFDVSPVREPRNPPTPIQHAVKSPRPEGEASPPNLRAEPTQIVLPPPIVQLPPPIPVIAAPIAGIANAPSAGSADILGPGYGAGGVGNGRDAGGAGNGDGSGGWVAPRQIKGRIKDSDYPSLAGEAGTGGTVGVRYRVGVDGRVTGCEVTRSSGSPDLDDATCRLIIERFRFRPSLDPDGRPVPATIVQNHSWLIHQLPPEEGKEDRGR